MDNKCINININRDDHNLNDYLFCWDKFSERPNKISLYNHYKAASFLSYVSNIRVSYNGLFTDIIPTTQDYIVNEKSLIELNDSIYISYVQYDKISDETIIGDVCLFYTNNSSDKINIILSDIEKIEISVDESNQKINTLNLTQSGLELDSVDLLNVDYENIDMYFNKETIKRSNKIIKSIQNSNKGLSVIYGNRGTGKTTLVNYIASSLEKMVIFIPCNMIETTINNPEFRNFLKKYKNSVIILDDCELYFSETYSKSNIFTNNLLQLVDGFQSDSLDLNIITILNEVDINKIDHILLDCNNLIDIIEVDKLKVKRASELCKYLGNKMKIEENTKVVDVLKKRKYEKVTNDIGFK